MADKPTLAQAWVGLIPTMTGAQAAVTKELSSVDAEPAGKKVGGKFAAGLKVAAVAAGVAVAKALSDSIRNATDLEQSVGGVDAVFKENSKTVHQWAKDAADSVGLSQNAYNELATVLGSQLKNAGTPLDEVATKTNTLIGLGADLSATYGGTASDAIEAVSAALKGEMDPIEKYGVSLNAAMLSQQAVSMGLSKNSGDWTTAQKQQIILAQLTAQTTDAQGQFAAQTGTVAEQSQILGAKYTNLTAQLGTALLPILVAVASAGSKVVDWLTQNKTATIAIVAVIGAFVAIMAAASVAQQLFVAGQVALKVAQGIATAAQWAWTAAMNASKIALAISTAAQWAFNAALTANPIGLIIAAIAALVAGLVLFFTKTKLGQAIWSALVAGFKAGWEWIKGAFKTGVAAVTGFLQGVWDFIKKVWHYSPYGIIADNWGKIMDFFKGIPGKIKDFFGKVKDFITAPFKAAFNLVAGFWNKTLGKVSFKVPDWVPGIGGKGWGFPQIPMLAMGGLVSGPTLAMIGEGRHPEVVAPLPAYRAMVDDAAAAREAPGAALFDYDRLAEAIVRASERGTNRALTGAAKMAESLARMGVRPGF